MEQWRLTTEPLKPGAHTLEVKCVDVAGNFTVEPTKFTSP